jgi:hypothetical protein
MALAVASRIAGTGAVLAAGTRCDHSPGFHASPEVQSRREALWQAAHDLIRAPGRADNADLRDGFFRPAGRGFRGCPPPARIVQEAHSYAVPQALKASTAVHR